MSLDHLMSILAAYRGTGVFNQYAQADERFDLPDAPATRRRNLHCYLQVFAHARFLLIGEAAGYGGCRFSGIPFTSEAQLVGSRPLEWAAGLDLARSSRAAAPWTERSAAAVWGALDGRLDCLLWNAFPWHPCGAQPLTNRAPGPALYDGLEALCCVLALFPQAQPCAVGRAAERALRLLGIEAPYIRHPAHGGQSAFRAGLAALLASRP